MPVQVSFQTLALQTLLKADAGLAQIVQQCGHLCQQMNVFAGAPVILVSAAEDIVLRRVGWRSALGIELGTIPHNPE